MKRTLLPFVLAFCGIACGVAAADVIYLTNGGKVRGRIVKENSRELVVKTAGGTTVVPRDEVATIEKGATIEELYTKRLAKIDQNSAEARYSLGRWLEGQGARVLARREFKKVIELDSEHRFAREKLGYVRQDGAWVKAISQKASTKRGKSGARSRARKRRAGFSVPVSPGLNKAYGALRKGKTSEDRKAGLESLLDMEAETQRLLGLVAKPEGKSLRAALQRRGVTIVEGQESQLQEPIAAYVSEVVAPALDQALVRYASRVRLVHQRGVRKAMGLFRDYQPGSELDDKRKTALSRWEKHRDAALKVIFDKQIYPDANHGRSGQPTVDEHVERVRAVWPAFDRTIGRDLMKIVRLPAEEAKALLERINEPERRMGELRPTLTKRSLQAEQLDSVPAALRAILAYQAGELGQARALQDALNPWERELMRRLSDERVRTYNREIQKQKLAKGVRPSGPEVEQVRVTNDYRILMGRPALEIDARLVQSARGHSADMTRMGFFDHSSPVAGKRSPSDRMAKAGYMGGGGENISMGSVTPMATHLAWYNSSGHHRNILGATYRCMGSGQDAEHWTQNFGMQGTLDR